MTGLAKITSARRERVKKSRRRTRRDGQVTLLGVRNRKSSMGQHTLPTLGPKKNRARGSSPSCPGQSCRNRRQGRVEERRVRRLKTIGFQCGQDTRHQPEGGRGDLQLTLEDALQPLHLGEGDCTPTLARKGTLTHQLGKGRVNRLRGSKKRVVSQAVVTRTRGEDAGHWARTASKSLRTRGHFLLNLRHTGVQTVTTPGGGRFRLAKPRLKTATRSLGVSQRTRGWANLMNQGR